MTNEKDSKKKNEYLKQYNRNYITRYIFKINEKNEDPCLVALLAQVNNKSACIKYCLQHCIKDYLKYEQHMTDEEIFAVSMDQKYVTRQNELQKNFENNLSLKNK